MTQADLALAAGSSSRHVSFLETGRAKPSRGMVIRLAEVLEIPLRHRNELLLAAGYAPLFGESAIDALQAAKAAMDQILEAHQPYPAFAVDRHWTIVASNRALPQLYEGVSEELLRPPVNAMRLMLHPDGMARRVLNYAAWRSYCLSVLRRQIEASGDSSLQLLAREVAGYPVPAGQGHEGDFDEAERLATPLRLATRLGAMRFLNTLTVFGTAQDITLSELTLEMLFPADQQTIQVAAMMVKERSQAAGAVRSASAPSSRNVPISR